MLTVNFYNVAESEAGARLDVFLSEENEQLSRSHVQKLISDGMVDVNGESVKANYRVKAGDNVILRIPPPVELKIEPEPISLDIYYEDCDVVVVNKSRGVVVHPAEGNYTGTLVNALLYHCRDLSGINGVMRPGIVHRLDKDTSGLLMVAKNDTAHMDLAAQLKDRRVTRRYLALIHGNIRESSGTVNAPIGRDPRDRQRMAVVDKNGKNAVTHYRVLERFGQYTFLELRLETGRTHQIRVHLAYLAHPVVGDPKYGPNRPHFDLYGQFLHAAILGFYHPRTGEYMEFKAPLPEVLDNILVNLRSQSNS